MNAMLKIRNLKVQCTIGCLEHEKSDPQEILVDLTIQTDISEAVQTDSVVDTIDYTMIAKVVSDVAKGEHFNLLETYAHEALHALFAQFPLQWVKIRVKKKTGIPLADYIAIELERENE
ncbi:MAG: dihydroneopterin aldolase [Chlamydiales bacterium]